MALISNSTGGNPHQTSWRIRKLPEWHLVCNDILARFFKDQSRHTGGWPWGFVIYRTSFTATSDQDWDAAIKKLDRYSYSSIASSEALEDFRPQFDIPKFVREGYRNLIVQDPDLEGASVATIRKRHKQWVEARGYDFNLGTPRFDYCIILGDRAIRSILASSEPPPERGSKSGLVGYVTIIDCDFDANDPENDCSEHYDGSVRLLLQDILCFSLHCDGLDSGEQQWGEWGLARPGNVMYTDGHCSTVEKQDVFLCPSGYDCYWRGCYPQFATTKTVTESEYKERQTLP
ncbi:hypothetical protein N7532_002016 [Penicillium argentinense]|uniref:Uncharacterized protein n=1 Tax=Penicillium argentinense TaxID=1131581 RepID=A0A9W9KMZ3_9EURO|nr:uncharacterized protein N7532_002016 [Penicillium argentinense]KAJ5111481.1 hypothetical protein N7532_002016 [Penicillium argentinense]